jgi:hypothetical protein
VSSEEGEMSIFPTKILLAIDGSSEAELFGTTCLLCGENSRRRPRASVTKRSGRLLRWREIDGLQPFRPIWSAMPTNPFDSQRFGRCARNQVCGLQES